MEQSTTLNKTLLNLAAEQRFGAASSLIGNYVSGTVKDQGGNGTTIRGVVTGVHFEDSGQAILELHDGRELPAAKVEQVTLVQNLPDEIQKELSGQGAVTTDSDAPAAAKAKPAQPVGAAARSEKSGHAEKSTGDGGLVGGIIRSLFGAGGSAGVSI